MKSTATTQSTWRVLWITTVFFVGSWVSTMLIALLPMAFFQFDDYRYGQILAKPMLRIAPFLLCGSYFIAKGLYRLGSALLGLPMVGVLVAIIGAIVNCFNAVYAQQ